MNAPPAVELHGVGKRYRINERRTLLAQPRCGGRAD